jgi:hypothetical protein
MRIWQIAALLAAGVSGGVTGAGQTRVDLSSQSKNVDFSQASSVRPFPTGASLPTMCSVGQMFFLTGSPLAVHECLSPNTWMSIQALNGTAIFDVQRTSDTQLTIGSLCSVSIPCVLRIGSVVYSVTAPATATLTNGSGLAYIYIDNNGNILVGVSSSSVSCAGCQVAGAVTQYPIGSIPLETWNASSGVWDPAGTNDVALLSTQPTLNAGSNITITQTGPNITIAASGGSGGSGSGSPIGTYFNPTDPTQWYRDHISLVSGFTSEDGWGYSGSCAVGNGSGATGFSQESVVPATWGRSPASGSICFFSFPSTGNYVYGSGTYDYWSGNTPAQLWISATYETTDTNGTHYVGLSSSPSGYSNFIGCRQSGAGNWFAVIRAAGVDVATADTGIPHDGNTHRLVVDNASGTTNTIRCSVDGSTAATASGTIPPQLFGWTYIFGAEATGVSPTDFAPFQYTIFLQGLPRL